MATILIIDDSQAHRAAIKRAVSAAAIFDRVLEAADGMQGLRLLLKEAVDVVLCDLEMPGFDGEKLLRVKHQSPGGSNIPFLFITASLDLERRARLLEDGACDAVTKPFHPADLVARLRLHLKIKKLQDELRVKNETLGRLSITDAVTGLRTRRYVNEFLSIEYLRAKRYRTGLAVLMADLDHFKRVNDEFGHLGGDAVLRGTARLLMTRLRATDVGGRYGGEEFLVVLSCGNAEGATVFANRWREDVEAERFALPDGREASVTVSVGVAEYDDAMESPEDLVAVADTALYKAKAAGRNCVIS